MQEVKQAGSGEITQRALWFHLAQRLKGWKSARSSASLGENGWDLRGLALFCGFF